MKKFIFKGTDTQGRISYEAEGNTVIELYIELRNNGTISTVDDDPLEIALMDKYNMTWEDFDDDYANFTQWESTVEGLTDDEILEVIFDERGNAYYKTISVYNEESGEYEEIN